VFSVVLVASVFKQRLGKHVPAEKSTYATIEVLLETEVSVGPCRVVITETTEATKAVLYGSLKGVLERLKLKIVQC
jgi:uncharacterized protein (UPF0548 family)